MWNYRRRVQWQYYPELLGDFQWPDEETVLSTLMVLKRSVHSLYKTDAALLDATFYCGLYRNEGELFMTKYSRVEQVNFVESSL